MKVTHTKVTREPAKPVHDAHRPHKTTGREQHYHTPDTPQNAAQRKENAPRPAGRDVPIFPYSPRQDEGS